MNFTLGIDFGTNSARALIVSCADGREVATAVAPYPSGREGILLDPKNRHLARQRPGDYLTSMQACVTQAVAAAARVKGFQPSRIVGIGVDATGSSPIPVDARNHALGQQARWRNDLSAQCWLWKDHTGWQEAAAITEAARARRPEYVAATGGTYSSEWWWSKLWHCLKVSPRVFAAAESWVELADWVPSLLAGVTSPRDVVRGICAAGHKAIFSDAWGGLPDEEFLRSLDPALASLRSRLYTRAVDGNTRAGELGPEWAQRLGLAPGTPIAIGQFDVHYGAVACDVREGTLVKVIGTSTCDCAVVKSGSITPLIPGICGAVPGSILPGWIGVEAGQSAVGDIFKWWVEEICGGNADTHAALAQQAAAQPPGASGLVALDWHNGNRTILVDPLLTGTLVGLTLSTTRAEIYRALIEGTAFGARVIIERLREHGVAIRRIVCAGGIAEKNPLLMQIYADVTGCMLDVSASGQACALGSAIGAAVAAGVHKDFPAAQKAMARVRRNAYRPRPRQRKIYHAIYAEYRRLHDAFAANGPSADLSAVMKHLLEIQRSSQ
ncbi:MAG TPA: ribulokinase [Opitutaceae bacterium]